MKAAKVSLIFVCLFFLLSGVPVAETVNLSSGKTFGYRVDFEDPPFFRLVSEEMVNGRPKFDYFLFIKAKLNGVYDISGGLQQEETFNVAKVDVWGSDDTKRFWMDMHQSQLRLRGERQTDLGTFVGYLEGDFWGGSKRFRLRHLWVRLGIIHFGQDWTFFGDKEIWPNIFEWDGPPSGVWRREPELRFLFERDSGLRWEIGIAQPSAEILFNPDVDSTISEANQPVPDFIGAVNKEFNWGHLRVTGIFRSLEYTTVADSAGNTSTKSVPGYGGTVSGLIRTNSTYGNMLQFQFVAGTGIATYLVSFSGLNYDAAPDGKGDLKAIPTFGGWASYEHFLNERWHFNLAAGGSLFKSHEIDSYTIPPPEYEASDSKIEISAWYSLVNIMYDPIPNMTLGLEWNYGKKNTAHEGTIVIDQGPPQETVSKVEKDRAAHRISFGMFFNF